MTMGVYTPQFHNPHRESGVPRYTFSMFNEAVDGGRWYNLKKCCAGSWVCFWHCLGSVNDSRVRQRWGTAAASWLSTHTRTQWGPHNCVLPAVNKQAKFSADIHHAAPEHVSQVPARNITASVPEIKVNGKSFSTQRLQIAPWNEMCVAFIVKLAAAVAVFVHKHFNSMKVFPFQTSIPAFHSASVHLARDRSWSLANLGSVERRCHFFHITSDSLRFNDLLRLHFNCTLVGGVLCCPVFSAAIPTKQLHSTSTSQPPLASTSMSPKTFHQEFSDAHDKLSHGSASSREHAHTQWLSSSNGQSLWHRSSWNNTWTLEMICSMIDSNSCGYHKI